MFRSGLALNEKKNMFPFEPERATTARCRSSSRASDLFVSAHHDHGAPEQHSMPFWHLALWFMIRRLHRMHVYKSYIWQVTYTRTHSYQTLVPWTMPIAARSCSNKYKSKDNSQIPRHACGTFFPIFCVFHRFPPFSTFFL